jgi:hypothetical protein
VCGLSSKSTPAAPLCWLDFRRGAKPLDMALLKLSGAGEEVGDQRELLDAVVPD